MVLSGIACADTVEKDHVESQITVVAENMPTHTHSPVNGADDCSPICVCHCCHIHIYFASHASIAQPDKIPGMYSVYAQNLIGIDIFDFLIPPKA